MKVEQAFKHLRIHLALQARYAAVMATMVLPRIALTLAWNMSVRLFRLRYYPIYIILRLLKP